MKRQWFVDPILFFVFVSWAVAFVFIKVALGPDGGFSPLAFLWPRMMLSAVVLFAMLPVMRLSLKLPREHMLKPVIIGIVGLGGYHLLFTIGLNMTTPVDTALIVGTGPVMTALWMPLFGMERSGLRAWIGIAICFATVVVISVTGAASNPTQAGWDMRRLFGDMIMLVAANCWALNGILCRRAIPHMKPTVITAWGMLWASAALLPFCAYSLYTQDWSAITPKGWWYFIYAVIPASTLSVALFYYGVKKVGPLHTIVYQNVSPIITALLVFAMFSRKPTVYQVVGIFTIFLGVYLTRTSKGVGHVRAANS